MLHLCWRVCLLLASATDNNFSDLLPVDRSSTRFLELSADLILVCCIQWCNHLLTQNEETLCLGLTAAV